MKMKQIPKYEYLMPLAVAGLGFLYGLVVWGWDWEELPGYALAGFLWYVLARLVFFVMMLGLTDIDERPSVAQPGNKVLVDLVKECHERVRRLSIFSRFILFAIIASVISGIFVFYDAESRSQANSRLGQLQALRYDYDYRLDADRFFRELRRNPDTNKLKEELKKEVDGIIKNWDEKINEEIKAITDTPSQEIIVSTITTRVGIIFLLIFLIQILVSLYRYNTKLLAFYNGQADLLSMLPVSESLDFEKLSKITSTESLDFVKREKAPADYALELAKKVIDKSK